MWYTLSNYYTIDVVITDISTYAKGISKYKQVQFNKKK